MHQSSKLYWHSWRRNGKKEKEEEEEGDEIKGEMDKECHYCCLTNSITDEAELWLVLHSVRCVQLNTWCRTIGIF